MFGDDYFRKQRNLSIFLLFILVLILSAACQGSHDFRTSDPGDVRSGLITVMDYPSEFTSYPYQIDFSELNSIYYDGTKTITAIEPDIYISMFDLKTPNGIIDHGRVWRIFCYHPPYDFPVYGTDSQPILNRYRLRYFLFSFIAPGRGYQTNMDLELCHRYYLRTAEGEIVVLIHVGHYIGGINRQHFYWSYVGK